MLRRNNTLCVTQTCWKGNNKEQLLRQLFQEKQPVVAAASC